jgi:iron complex transport system permease protein
MHAQQRSAMTSFMFGSLGAFDWPRLRYAWVLVLAVPLFVLAPQLDALELGRPHAAALGVRLSGVERASIGMAAALCAVAAVLAGDVAFVGLIAPHLARRMFGVRHRLRLAGAALAGADLVFTADVVGRSMFAHCDVPAGAVLGFFGVPIFVTLLWRRDLTPQVTP